MLDDLDITRCVACESSYGSMECSQCPLYKPDKWEKEDLEEMESYRMMGYKNNIDGIEVHVDGGNGTILIKFDEKNEYYKKHLERLINRINIGKYLMEIGIALFSY